MWIPHTIPKSTFRLFAPSDSICRTLPNEIGRTVKSEDFSWANRAPSPLKSLCLDAIAEGFANYTQNLFESITPMNAVYLVEVLDTSLPIPSVIRVPDGEYWRRRHEDAWPDSKQDHRDLTTNLSMKSSYLTEHVSHIVENLEPGQEDEKELVALLTACSPYVTEIQCQRLRAPDPRLTDGPNNDLAEAMKPAAHVDLSIVLQHLQHLRVLSVVYGPMSINDVDALGRTLVTANRLTSLTVTKSSLNAVLFDRLQSYLIKCPRLEQLELSFCELDSLGAKLVARYANVTGELRSIDLRGNHIGPDGAEALAYVAMTRRQNSFSPIRLNLDTNEIDDLGAEYLASALASEVRPFIELSIRDCNISTTGGLSIVKSLAFDRGLRTLKIDNNSLSSDVALALYNVMKTNFNIENLSTHNVGFSGKISNFFCRVAFYNRNNKRPELTYEDFDDLYDETKEDSTENCKQQNYEM